MMFKRRNPLDETGAVEMEAHELAIRFKHGQQFRLVCLPYTLPRTFPVQVRGDWPLIVEAKFDTNPGRQAVVLLNTEHLAAIGEWYQARPNDHVIVVPDGRR